MSKLTRKLVLRITAVLCIVFVLTFALNTYFLPKYFLYQKKNKLAELTGELAGLPHQQLLTQVERIEERYGVTVVSAPLSESVNNLNSQILLSLSRKGIALSKFWLTDDSMAKLQGGKQVSKLYDQAKMKSSFLVTFFPAGGDVVAIGESIAYSSEMMGIVNRFNLYIWIGMLLLLFILSVLYTAKIVRPLAKLNETAKAISELTFTRVDIRTGDEIESLAVSINKMSDSLKKAHRSLEAKNANLRTFIADVSHELKTPLALIKVYASGIEDGLDDGSYAGVIRRQSEEMAGMIDRLLELSKLQTEVYELQPLEFHRLLAEMVEDYRVAFRQRNLELQVEDRLPEETWVMADRRKLESVLRNLLSNAMKYAVGHEVNIKLDISGQAVQFRIINNADTGDNEKWERIWEPFFVMESSRSKKLSGTGLGLSITGTILQKHHAVYGHEAKEGIVEFYFSLPLVSADIAADGFPAQAQPAKPLK